LMSTRLILPWSNDLQILNSRIFLKPVGKYTLKKALLKEQLKRQKTPLITFWYII
jgi:hypothetical protein